MLGIFKSKAKPFFDIRENDLIVKAIQHCEQNTSGEIRVYIEAKNPLVSPMERAMVIFTGLKMHLTEERNGVLLYIAHKHKEVALIADEGIYKKVGQQFWDDEVKKMLEKFKNEQLADGIQHCVLEVGQVLKQTFPYKSGIDKNELPDEIVFGKL
ncbi:MAG: TPM domain-containing protein [Ferruginibacter sp.]